MTVTHYLNSDSDWAAQAGHPGPARARAGPGPGQASQRAGLGPCQYDCQLLEFVTMTGAGRVVVMVSLAL